MLKHTEKGGWMWIKPIFLILMGLLSCREPRLKKSKINQPTDSFPIDCVKKIPTDFTKEVKFIDTIFTDGSSMKISSHFKKNGDPDLETYFLDSLVLDLVYLENSARLTYYISGASHGEPQIIDRLMDPKGNLYCFMQFPSATTYGSTILIGYKQSKAGFQKISFNKGEDGLFTSYCSFVISIEKIIRSCSAKPSSGVYADTDYIYTRNTETSYVITKTEIKN